MSNHQVNPQLHTMAMQAVAGYIGKVAAEEKKAFIPGSDPAMGGGGMPPGGDPMAAAGGGMPMDPAMMGGGMPMDPAMMGGAMPPAPPAAPAPAPAAPAAAPEQVKPKIDVNVEIMQIKHMLARLADAMGVQLSAAEMAATPEKLTEMAQGGGPGGAVGGGDPSAIQPPQPIDPMQAATPAEKGASIHDRTGFNTPDTAGLGETASRASAILAIRGRSNGSAA